MSHYDAAKANTRKLSEGDLYCVRVCCLWIANNHVLRCQAHERGLNTDLLLAFLKPLLKTREDLRVVIMSASMDTSLFSNYFSGCPVLQIDGRWAAALPYL